MFQNLNFSRRNFITVSVLYHSICCVSVKVLAKGMILILLRNKYRLLEKKMETSFVNVSKHFTFLTLNCKLQ